MTYDDMENTSHYIESIPTFDPTKSEFERKMSLNQDSKLDHLKLMEEKVGMDNDDPEMIEEMWAEFDGAAEEARLTSRDFAMGNWDLDEEYNQVTFLVGGYEKDYTGLANDWRSRRTCEEFERLIEDVYGKKRI